MLVGAPKEIKIQEHRVGQGGVGAAQALRQQHVQELAAELAGWPREQPFGGSVQVDDAVGGIRADHRVDDGVEQGERVELFQGRFQRSAAQRANTPRARTAWKWTSSCRWAARASCW